MHYFKNKSFQSLVLTTKLKQPRNKTWREKNTKQLKAIKVALVET